jgi:uncharacterized protein YdhG (YjbR/CyaY superfamily)
MNSDVQAFIDTADPARKELYLKIQAMIYEVQPSIETKKAYGVVKYYYGKSCIYLGYWKQGVSIYPGYIDELSDFRTKYPTIKTRVGTINLKLTDDIPWQDLREIIAKKLITE